VPGCIGLNGDLPIRLPSPKIRSAPIRLVKRLADAQWIDLHADKIQLPPARELRDLSVDTMDIRSPAVARLPLE
jgi:hypothetical protein